MSERGNSNFIKLGIFEYNPADVLGSGAFAIVYKGHFVDKPQQEVAIKQMIKGQNVLKSKTLLSKEIAVLKDLNHDNIVRLYDHSISNSEVYLVMEFCNGGDLSDYLHNKKTLPEETIRHFLMQIGSSMDCMNKRTIMHRDLKPGNILLKYYGDFKSVNDVPGHLITFKLADFGFARFLHDGIMAETMCGSPMYMAPEVLMCRKYDGRADIWSMGVIVYQCHLGKAPFYANSPEALKNIYEKTVDLKPKIPKETSPYLRDLLLKMLIRKPADRIDFPSLLSHPFLQAKKVASSDLLSKHPANAPALPGSVRRGQATAAHPSHRPTYQTRQTNRTYATPALPLRHPPQNMCSEPVPPHVSKIASFMPIPNRTSLGRGSVEPSRITGIRRPQGPQLAVTPPPTYREYERSTRPNLYESDSTATTATTSDDEAEQGASLTPTDEFIEDGLGGSSFLSGHRLVGIEGGGDLSTDGYAGLASCLTDVLSGTQQPATRNRRQQQPPPPAGGRYAEPPTLCETSLDRKQLEEYVIVDTSGAEVLPDRGIIQNNPIPARKEQLQDYYQLEWTRNVPGDSNSSSEGVLQNPPISAASFRAGQQPTRRPPTCPPTNHGRFSADGNKGSCPADISWKGAGMSPTDRGYPEKNQNRALDDCRKPIFQTVSNVNLCNQGAGVHQQANNAVGNRPSHGAEFSGMNVSPELMEENLMEPEHTKQMQTVTMVLELCELLTGLAERRASALTDVTTTLATELPTYPPPPDDQSAATTGNQDDNADSDAEDRSARSTPTTQKRSSKTLELIPEAKRIVEQLVLYRRILYYLEYVFEQVKKAVDSGRVKPTAIAKQRVTDCNALYHRCYIRLCHLSRQSRRDDLIEPVGRLLSRITANRLIFNYALDQCYAAEMDDYIGELGLCLRRYRIAIILIHGLCQHAKSPSDNALLSDCLRLILERHANLFDFATDRTGIPSSDSQHMSPSPAGISPGYGGQRGLVITGRSGSPR